MATNMNILLVNPPANVIEKPDFGELWGTVQHTFTSDNILVHAINHGLLSIGSYLKKHGHNVTILDLSYDPNNVDNASNAFARLKICLNNVKFDIVGISSQSGYDYLESLECATIVKQVQPKCTTIIGGQHAGFLGKTPLQENNSIDVLIKGEGEAVFMAICAGEELKTIPGIVYRDKGRICVNDGIMKPVDLTELRLDYTLYPNFSDFAPIVEESRGCPFDCHFCTNRQIYPAGIRYKPAEQIYEELLTVLELWGEKAYSQIIIFSAAQFGHNIENTLKLVELITPLNITWTAEFRVDSKLSDYLDVLYASGLRLIALGLESADESILKLMNKTTNPKIYLKKCDELIGKASKYIDLVIRLNIMFYVGESTSTILTLNFLIEHKNYIDAIYVQPIYFNPGTKIMECEDDYSSRFGTKLYTNDYWKKRHLFFCDPSSKFKFQELIVFSSILEKLFSSEYGWSVTEDMHYLHKEKK